MKSYVKYDFITGRCRNESGKSRCCHRRPGLAAIGAGIGIGKIGANAMDAIARQPEQTGNIRTNMIVIAALIEGVALFAIIVCLLALFI